MKKLTPVLVVLLFAFSMTGCAEDAPQSADLQTNLFSSISSWFSGDDAETDTPPPVAEDQHDTADNDGTTTADDDQAANDAGYTGTGSSYTGTGSVNDGDRVDTPADTADSNDTTASDRTEPTPSSPVGIAPAPAEPAVAETEAGTETNTEAAAEETRLREPETPPAPAVIWEEIDAFKYPDAETCRDNGGSWIRGLDANKTFICVQPHSDAGKPCSDSSECLGQCLGREDKSSGEWNGYCQKNNDPFGCFAIMKAGTTEPDKICVREWKGELPEVMPSIFDEYETQ